MSTTLTYDKFGNTSGADGIYIQVGFPLHGNEAWGTVRWYSTCNGLWDGIKTTTPCPGNEQFAFHEIEDLTRRPEKSARCTGCDLVLKAMPTEGFAYGFRPWEDRYKPYEKRSKLVADVAPYDPIRHGPNGAATMEETFAKAEAYLAAWTESFGPGPWYVLDYSNDDLENDVGIFTREAWMNHPEDQHFVNAIAGPYDSLEHALHAKRMHERTLNARWHNSDEDDERVGWRNMNRHHENAHVIVHGEGEGGSYAAILRWHDYKEAAGDRAHGTWIGKTLVGGSRWLAPKEGHRLAGPFFSRNLAQRHIDDVGLDGLANVTIEQVEAMLEEDRYVAVHVPKETSGDDVLPFFY